MVDPLSPANATTAQLGSASKPPAEIAAKILDDNHWMLSGYDFSAIKRELAQLTARDPELGAAVLAEVNDQLKTTTNRAALAAATYSLDTKDGGGLVISSTGPTVRDYFEGANGTNNAVSRAHYARLDTLWGDGNARTDDVAKIDAGIIDLIKSGLTLEQYEAIKGSAAAESTDPATVALDLVQMSLDIGGIIDQTGALDAANGLISLGRGNWGDAALSLVAAVPLIGGLAVLGKLGKWPQKIANAIQLAADNPAARAILEPVLKKIHDALSAVPNSVINALPENVRNVLGGIKNKLDEFFGKVPDLSTRFAEVYRLAPAAKAQIDRLADSIAETVGGRVAKAPIKSETRALEKIIADYGGDVTKIKDLARNTIIVGSDKIDDVIRQLESSGAVVKRIDGSSNPMGYSGVNATIRTDSGLLAEIQVNTPTMIFAKETPANARAILGDEAYDQIARQTGAPGGLGHELYEKWRVLPEGDPGRAALEAESRAYYELFR